MSKIQCPKGHGEFEMLEGCPQCTADRMAAEGNTEASIAEDISKAGAGDVPPSVGETTAVEPEEQTFGSREPIPEPEPVTALINIGVGQDPKVLALYEESCALLKYSKSRVITVNQDLDSVTEDLSVIAGLKKAIEEKRKEYVGPIREHLDAVNLAFKNFIAPLLEADTINRNKVTEFRKIEADKAALARREMEAKGETTVEQKEPIPARVHTETGTMGTQKVYKWEVTDITQVPAEYLLPNAGMITGVVKGSKGKVVIPGIKIWEEDTIKVKARKGV